MKDKTLFEFSECNCGCEFAQIQTDTFYVKSYHMNLNHKSVYADPGYSDAKDEVPLICMECSQQFIWNYKTDEIFIVEEIDESNTPDLKREKLEDSARDIPNEMGGKE